MKYFAMLLRSASTVLLAIALSVSCGEDTGTGVVSSRVTDPFPLALGNTWQYSMEQSIFIQEDTTEAPLVASSTGQQTVSIDRTEMITGDEAFGLKFTHYMNYLFGTGRDTVVEAHYYASRDDRVVLKAEAGIFNPTGGFIPFSENDTGRRRYGTWVEVDGAQKFVSLERLGHIMMGTGSHLWSGLDGGDAPLLASDGIINEENVVYYPEDFVFVFKELFKGRNWISNQAQGIGGLDIRQKVTNVLDGLGQFEGPIAEVERTNAFIEATVSNKYVQRYYFKSGIGLIQAEISDPEFLILLQMPDGSIEYLGIGTWTFVKRLESYSLN